MADCIHGFPQGQCLICSTLARSGPERATTQVADKPVGALAGNGATRRPATSDAPKQARSGSAPDGSRPERRGRHHLVTAVLVIVVGVLAFALFQGVLGLALRVAEYVAVALLAGWVGYRVGHWRARHEAKRT